MSLQAHHKANFETLRTAAQAGHLALMDCTDTRTGQQVPTLCAVAFDGREYVFTPLAALLDGNPYDYLQPPSSGPSH